MLHLQSTQSLPIIPKDERNRLSNYSKTKHSEILANQQFATTVELNQAPTCKQLNSNIRVIAWNLERCYHINASAELLASLNADIILLSEMDMGMARTDQKHTTACLAEKLGYGYVYGVEFLEFGLGSAVETAKFHGQSNQVGYHGNAILSRTELEQPGLVRLDDSGEIWFNPGMETRLGGRVAVLATIKIDNQDVVFASVHLEDRTNPENRAEQVAVLLKAIEDYNPGAPTVIGGDFNTHSFDLHKLSSSIDQVRQLMKQDPHRLLHPQKHEPLFSLANNLGYEWENCNQLGAATDRKITKPLSLVGDKKMDWFLTRGLSVFNPAVIAATPTDIAYPLSDHELIVIDIKI